MTTRIEISPDYVERLQAAGLASFESFMEMTGGTVTSRHKDRTTVGLQLPAIDATTQFYLKRVFHIPWRRALKDGRNAAHGHSRPWKEWWACHELAKAGIPTMKPVVVGERRTLGLPREAFLLVEAVPEQWTLQHWVIPGFPRPFEIDGDVRNRLFLELGCLIRRMADAGFSWPDIAAKHIFTEPRKIANDSAAWQLHLIDLERVERIQAPEIESNLKRLLTAFCNSLIPMRWRNEDVLAFGEGLGKTPSIVEEFAARSERLPRLPSDYVHPHARKMIGSNSFSIDAKRSDLLRSIGISNLDDVFRLQGEGLTKSGLAGHRTRIRIQAQDPASSVRCTLYLKRYNRPPFTDQFRRCFEIGAKRSSAEREVYFIRHLGELGISTMPLIASGQEMAGAIEKRSFSLTGEIPGESLEKLVKWIENDPSAMPSPRRRHDLVRQLARVVAIMHNAEMFHRDLYLSHVFITWSPEGLAEIRLIDLARMIRRPKLTQRWIIKDLAALDYSSPPGIVTFTDRIRFLYDYLPDSALASRTIRKKTAGEIIEKVRKRTARMARHDVNRAARFGTDSQRGVQGAMRSSS